MRINADEIIARNMNGKSNEEIYKSTIDSITPETICLSVGGDVYCYPNWQRYSLIHNEALKKGAKSILWSCSFEPSMLTDELIETLKTHHLIAVRESLSEKILKKYGFDNVVRISDIAFDLVPKETQIPEGNYIVLNLSPLVIRKNPDVLTAYQKLVDEIIKNTKLNIALLPHVEVSVDNDYDALSKLYGDERRIFRIPTGLTAAEYKYIISRSEFCIAARTHATIASWSSLVPTIAIGYSTKARGIAGDLGQERFVIDIKDINSDILLQKFKELAAERVAIQNTLFENVNECKKLLEFSRLEKMLKN